MHFTETELELIVSALSHAVDEVHNQIATCPDIFEYAADIDELENVKAEYTELMGKILEHQNAKE